MKSETPKRIRKYWKVEMTPGVQEFLRLAARHKMSGAELLRAVPEVWTERVTSNELRMWMARSLRYLECIHERVTANGGRLPTELHDPIKQGLSDINSVLGKAKRRRRDS